MSLIVSSPGVSSFNSVNKRYEKVTITPRDSSRSWRAVAASSTGQYQFATVYPGQIYTSSDFGVTWTARESSRNWSSIACSIDGSKVVATVNGGQIYTSTDFGATWTARDSSRNWGDVASDSTGTNLAASVISGQIYTSTNSGVSWTARDSNRLWSSIVSNSTGTKLVANVSNGQIYTSTNSGVSWTARDSTRFWYTLSCDSTGTYLVSTETGGGLYSSSDSGVTWTIRSSAGSGNWGCTSMSSDGSIAIGSPDANSMVVSYDYGVNWVAMQNYPQNWNSITLYAGGLNALASTTSSTLFTFQQIVPYFYNLSSNSIIGTFLSSSYDNITSIYIPPTVISAASATTTTSLSGLTLYQPYASTNLTATNIYSLNVVTGKSLFGEGIKIGTNGTNFTMVQHGQVTFTIGSGIAVGSNVTSVVTFATAFASNPKVLVTNNGGVSGGDGLNCITTNPSTTGFTIALRNVGTGTTGTGSELVSWIAWI